MLLCLIMPVYSLKALSLLCTNVRKDVITKCCIAENTSERYNQVFSSTPLLSWASVSELVDDFNSKISNVTDAIAPTKVTLVSDTKNSPWRNAMLVRAEKKTMSKS